jgi:NAD(P)-dependent dehydrogenase (short-subunit alcohol dehydrogenase family)
MSDEIQGRTALVTGAGRGIGRAIAVELAAAGASVALLARSKDELEETARLVIESGGRAVPVVADLRRTERIADYVAEAEKQFGPIEILVNNAGVGWPLGVSTNITLDDWAAAIAINLTASVAATFVVLPAMLAAGWGRIVNVSSIAVARPTAMIGTNAYVTSKTALEAHTVNLAAEIEGNGVTVNAFRPGSVDTSMQADIRDAKPGTVGVALQTRFNQAYASGALITAAESARSFMDHLRSGGNGQIWDASDTL